MKISFHTNAIYTKNVDRMGMNMYKWIIQQD